MGISITELPPNAQQQVAAKLAIEQVKRNRTQNKYRNEKAEVNGIVFASRKEANRYSELLLLLRKGSISNLRVQVDYTLLPAQTKQNGNVERGVKYRADFVYEKDGKTIVEDTKGFRTPEYIIKRKLMLYVHGIEITEI